MTEEHGDEHLFKEFQGEVFGYCLNTAEASRCFVSSVCESQCEAKEDLQKSRSKVEELNNAKNDAENNNSRLTSDLKALREKSEKVSCPCYKWKKDYIINNG